MRIKRNGAHRYGIYLGSRALDVGTFASRAAAEKELSRIRTDRLIEVLTNLTPREIKAMRREFMKRRKR